ncbi:MAG: glycosyltransferase family 39 protein, partial [Chloroflexota bacterium]|nr:glycosyltransferase family 39 protein [Chloroflexota bacterium]
MFVQTAKAAAAPLSRTPSAFLLVILLLAAVPRLMGIGWDGGYMAHPDERHIYDVTAVRLQWTGPSSALLDAENSSMNPRRSDGAGGHLGYSYGALLVYGLKGVSSVVAVVAGDRYAEFAGLYRVGRPLAALADLLTIFCVYLLGVRLFSRRVGLLAAALSAATVLQVQFSHFYVAEPIMTLFLTAALLQVVRALQDRNSRAVLYAGVLLGLAVATKPSAAAFVPAALLLLFTGEYAVQSRAGVAGWRYRQRRILRAGRLAVVAGAVSVAAWAVWEPYAVLDIRTYIEIVLAESRIQRGITDVPFTRQYIGTIPGLYHLGQYVRWGVGLPLGVAVVAGSLWGAYRAILRRDLHCALLFGWIAPYTLSILALEAKWLRYMLPITPVLLLLVSAALWTWHTHRWAARRRRVPLKQLRTRLALLAMFAVLSGSMLWTIAWSSIYTRPHNWMQASEWIYANVEPGSTLAHEAWDERLPYRLPGQDADAYEYLQVDTYEDLSPDQRIFAIQDLLTAADYIVLPTPRLWATVPKSPWRYAVATRYFDLLFEERLGFRRVAVFEDSPGLGGARIDDTGSDDNVAVYDHPQVLIFRKERELQQWELDALFAEARQAPWEATRQGSVEKSLLLAPYKDAAVTGVGYFQGNWSSGVSSIFAWLLVLELLATVAWLLLRGLLRPLPDAGWVLSRVLGLLLVAWLSWLLAATGVLPSTPWAAWLVLAGLLAVALVLTFRSRAELRADLRAVGSTIVLFEALFLILFGLGLLLR